MVDFVQQSKISIADNEKIAENEHGDIESLYVVRLIIMCLGSILLGFIFIKYTPIPDSICIAFVITVTVGYVSVYEYIITHIFPNFGSRMTSMLFYGDIHDDYVNNELMNFEQFVILASKDIKNQFLPKLIMGKRSLNILEEYVDYRMLSVRYARIYNEIKALLYVFALMDESEFNEFEFNQQIKKSDCIPAITRQELKKFIIATVRYVKDDKTSEALVTMKKMLLTDQHESSILTNRYNKILKEIGK